VFGQSEKDHIPEVYMKSTVENRLKLLAGIIDKCGHMNEKRYEIIEKSEQLALDIVTLAKSLGFFSYSVPKKDSHRVIIVVNQVNHVIPVLISSKKIKCEDKTVFNNPVIRTSESKKLVQQSWTPELDKALEEAVKTYGKKTIPWKKITQVVPVFNNSSPDSIKCRWNTVVSRGTQT
jgi:hypothetical protein